MLPGLFSGATSAPVAWDPAAGALSEPPADGTASADAFGALLAATIDAAEQPLASSAPAADGQPGLQPEPMLSVLPDLWLSLLSGEPIEDAGPGAPATPDEDGEPLGESVSEADASTIAWAVPMPVPVPVPIRPPVDAATSVADVPTDAMAAADTMAASAPSWPGAIADAQAGAGPAAMSDAGESAMPVAGAEADALEAATRGDTTAVPSKGAARPSESSDQRPAGADQGPRPSTSAGAQPVIPEVAAEAAPQAPEATARPVFGGETQAAEPGTSITGQTRRSDAAMPSSRSPEAAAARAVSDQGPAAGHSGTGTGQTASGAGRAAMPTAAAPSHEPDRAASSASAAAATGSADAGGEGGQRVQEVPGATATGFSRDGGDGSQDRSREEGDQATAHDAAVTGAAREAPPVRVAEAPPQASTAVTTGPTPVGRAAPADAAPTAALLGDPHVEAENMSRLVESMRVQWRQGVSEATVRLKPEHLGEVTISIRVDRGMVSAVVHAEAPAVQQWLEQQEERLRSGLADQGLNLEKFLVHRDRQQERREGRQYQPPSRYRQPREQDQRFEVIA